MNSICHPVSPTAFPDVHPVPLAVASAATLGRPAGIIGIAAIKWPHLWASAPDQFGDWRTAFADSSSD